MNSLSDKPISFYLRYLPLVLIQVYLSLTLLLYQFGPLKWDTQNKTLFWIFLLNYQLILAAGFIYGIQKYRKRIIKNDQINSIRIKTAILKNLWFILTIVVLSSFFKYKNVLMVNSFFEYNLLEEFLKGLSNPGQQYVNKLLNAETYRGSKLLTAFSGITSVFAFSLIPIFTFYWEEIRVKHKIIFFTVCNFEIVMYVAIGTNKGIFDQNFMLMISISLALIISLKEKVHVILKKKFILIAITILMILFSLWFFQEGMRTRTGIHGTIFTSFEKWNERSQILNNDKQLIMFPTYRYPELSYNDSIGRVVNGASIYLGSGYFVFSLALSESFETAYGFGNSAFLYNNIEHFFNVDIKNRLYETKVKKKFYNTFFHTAYLDFANDIHFIGVFLLLFIFGILTAYVWYDVILFNNIIAIILLHLLVLFYIYLPAFNQVFMGINMFFSFFEVLAIWLWFRITSLEC